MSHFKLEVKEAAELLGVTERSVHRQIKAGDIFCERVKSRGKTGWKYVLPLAAFPAPAQAEYLKSRGIVKDSGSVPALNVKSPMPQAKAIAGWAEKEALAKAELIHTWHKIKESASNSGKTVGAALKEFLEVYNTGHFLENLYKVVGSVSRGSIYRWERDLVNGGSDYRALAPERGICKERKTKVTEVEANVLLTQLMHPNKIKLDTAIKMTRYILEKRGIESTSSRMTLRRYAENFKKRHYDMWVMLREGEKALNDKVLPYLKRNSSLLEVGDVLVGDGHKLNFQVIHPYTGKPCRATLLGMYDWASRDLVGYEIMVEENVQAVAGAVRNAVLELGKIPKAVLLDNGKAFKAKVFTSDMNLDECAYYGMFARLGIVTHFAWPYNAQSKPIERFFGTFSDSFERLMPSFIGASIDDKPASMRRNEKFLKSLHNDWVPTIPEAMALIGSWREYYRTQPHGGLDGRTPGQVLNSGRGEGIDARELDYLMLSVETASIGRNGIRFLGNEYFHEALYGFRERVILRYSFFDLTHIFVYTMKNEYLCAAKMVEAVHPMASLTGNPVTMDAVKEGIRRKRALKRQTLKVVKMAKDSCVDLALPWQNIVQSVPKIAEHIESLEADRVAATASLADTVTVEDGEAALARMEVNEPKIYRYAFEKYEDLLMKKKKDLTKEEKDWIADFKMTDEYKYSYTMGGSKNER